MNVSLFYDLAALVDKAAESGGTDELRELRQMLRMWHGINPDSGEHVGHLIARINLTLEGGGDDD